MKSQCMMFEMKATEQYRLMWCCLFQMVLNIESSLSIKS